MSSKIAIIPARGGSKRIPRKNIKDFLGKPIITYSIEAAVKSNLFDTVMVSTDDEEIAGIAKESGAEVPFFRSNKASNDMATTYEVLKEVFVEFEKRGRVFSEGCCIYPTAPFVTSEILSEGYGKLVEEKLTTIFPIVPFDYPVWRGLILNESRVQMKWPEFQSSRSQDLEPLYHDAGQWYWFDTEKLLASGQLFTKNTGFVPLGNNQVHDIDTDEDWKIAELKFKALSDAKSLS